MARLSSENPVVKPLEGLLNSDWQQVLQDQFHKKYWRDLEASLEKEIESFEVYPAVNQWFRAFDTSTFQDVKVLILGQDPYHGPLQANGLSFSVNQGIKVPPSLRNIHKELLAEYPDKFQLPTDLSCWAEQGVLMLNSCLTVRAGEAGSHQGLGWEKFTDSVIDLLCRREQPCVFILWGNWAKTKIPLIPKSTYHLIISSAHPSPLSAFRGFFGSKPFSKTNFFLNSHNLPIVNW